MQSGISFFFALNALQAESTRRLQIAPGTLDYIRVQGKLCSPWLMTSFEPSERINDMICDMSHTGKQTVSGVP